MEARYGPPNVFAEIQDFFIRQFGRENTEIIAIAAVLALFLICGLFTAARKEKERETYREAEKFKTLENAVKAKFPSLEEMLVDVRNRLVAAEERAEQAEERAERAEKELKKLRARLPPPEQPEEPKDVEQPE